MNFLHSSVDFITIDIESKHRGSEAKRLLIEKMELLLKEEGITEIWFDIWEVNKRSMKAFEKEGYKADIHLYHKELKSKL